MGILRLYSTTGMEEIQEKIEHSLHFLSISYVSVEVESCFYIEFEDDTDQEERGKFSSQQMKKIRWIFGETYGTELSFHSHFKGQEEEEEEEEEGNRVTIEIGPRLNFTTSYGTNASSICVSCGITNIKRVEKSRRICIHFVRKVNEIAKEIERERERERERAKEREGERGRERERESERERKKESAQKVEGKFLSFLDRIHDKMTECVYSLSPSLSLSLPLSPPPPPPHPLHHSLPFSLPLPMAFRPSPGGRREGTPLHQRGDGAELGRE